MILKNESLTNWIDNNLLVVKEVNERVIEITNIGKFLLVEPKNLTLPDGTTKDNLLFDPEFQVVLNSIEDKYSSDVDYLLLQFGNKWYYTDSLTPEILKEFKYLGETHLTFIDSIAPAIGIHGTYELCNASGAYQDWCKKAVFTKTETLGICEQNTLAGTLDFQNCCKEAGLKSIIGETVTILTESKAKINIKIYVQDEDGWKNLLWINKLINVDNGGEYITEKQLLNKDLNTEGLIIVLTPEVDLDHYYPKFDYYFAYVYYQIDFSEWSSQSRDEFWLNSLKYYLENYFNGGDTSLKPILINDAYYLDKEDSVIIKSLNNIGKVGFKNQSADQYFKTIDDIFLQALSLFGETDERSVNLMDTAILNCKELCASIDFKIPVGFFRLPEYEMNYNEKSLHNTNEDLFWSIIEQGLEAKVFGQVADEQIYLDRVEMEFEILKEGGFIDYFLILADIIRWCKTQDILVGIGRGSSAGSLIAYCTGITNIDPIKYGLIFERFINKGRIGKSLPDIDTDFQGERRDDVKAYIENKYGKEYVASIGSYTTMKIKSSIKDLCREKGIDYNKTSFVVGQLEPESTFTELFKIASEKEDVKKFIQKNYSIVEKLSLCLNQPKSSSVHASGVLIVPKNLGSIYNQMPVKLIDGQLVSEWEGEFIDKAGFLKLDILGIKQLDKLAAIFKLIKEHTKEEIDFDEIHLNDKNVMQLFKNGFTNDVFQFGTQGLQAYCKELKPDSIEDLIAAVALYRPSAMESGAHKKYIRIKNKFEPLVYDEGTEKITKGTHGILIYQEQIMQVCTQMAGFSLVESDDIRKAMGKKDAALLDSYKDKFLQGCLKNGFTKSKVLALWDKMESFSAYGFNKSHAAAYAITGYYCQWLKYHYPLQFWTVSMQYADEKDIINRISEIGKISDIEVATVDINKSIKTFFAEDKSIYWSITSVKWVGEKAVDQILEDRSKNGEYYSLEDFCERVTGEGSKVNKRSVINLILAGAFDKTEKIKFGNRYKLLERYQEFSNKELSEELLESKNWKEYQWVFKQKELTGYGVIDYRKLVKGSTLFATQQKKYTENAEVLTADAEARENVVISGILLNCFDKPFKGKGQRGLGANLEILDNTDIIRVVIWMDVWQEIAEKVLGNKGKIIILSGIVSWDAYRNSNCIQSSKKTQVEII